MTDIIFESTSQLTQSVLEHLYHRNPEPVFPHLHPSILWIGALRPNPISGYNSVCAYLMEISDMPDCSLSGQRYSVLCKSRDTCVVTGQYAVSFSGRPGLSHAFRITLIWTLCGQSLKLLHIHISIPHTPLRPDPELPSSMLYFRGIHGETYFFHPDEIIYLEASNSCCCLYSTTCHVCICQSLSVISQTLPSCFIRIHRSYIVNRGFITELRRYCVTLKDKTVLPVPEKKYSSLKHLLNCL